ncbi:MAG: pyridoxal 5'-phosphate synthase glutaminase subunit PdxT [Actinobacteria bacterium]|nr:MAG: pyridoxal 5'-phosphate synthase glutaminase subunit PdxT [Actinomycetota bacterium]
MRIGVLALQGACREHLRMLERCGVSPVAVKKPSELLGLEGLVIPGGESTTIGKLMVTYGLAEPIKGRHERGMAIYGSCAGLVLLAASTVEHTGQPLLGLMDIVARRNAFGRQCDSFEAELDIPPIGAEPLTGVFIRAPWIESAGEKVQLIASYEGHGIMARQGRVLVTAFHPELTDDERIHRYFLKEVVARQ